jgi:hypothetical protein
LQPFFYSDCNAIFLLGNMLHFVHKILLDRQKEKKRKKKKKTTLWERANKD